MKDNEIQRDKIRNKIEELIKKNEGPFSLVICDIDDFKVFNELYGKQTGTNMINKILAVLENNLSSKKIISQKGDEFTILLEERGAERCFMELEEIRRYISDNRFDFEDIKNINLTLSFGIASYPRDSKNTIELFRVADSALFRAKKLGKNRICLSEVESMVLKSSYFTKTQLDRLSKLSKEKERTEAFLLREALDDLFEKYSD